MQPDQGGRRRSRLPYRRPVVRVIDRACTVCVKGADMADFHEEDAVAVLQVALESQLPEPGAAECHLRLFPLPTTFPDAPAACVVGSVAVPASHAACDVRVTLTAAEVRAALGGRDATELPIGAGVRLLQASPAFQLLPVDVRQPLVRPVHVALPSAEVAARDGLEVSLWPPFSDVGASVSPSVELVRASAPKEGTRATLLAPMGHRAESVEVRCQLGRTVWVCHVAFVPARVVAELQGAPEAVLADLAFVLDAATAGRRSALASSALQSLLQHCCAAEHRSTEAWLAGPVRTSLADAVPLERFPVAPPPPSVLEWIRGDAPDPEPEEYVDSVWGHAVSTCEQRGPAWPRACRAPLGSPNLACLTRLPCLALGMGRREARAAQHRMAAAVHQAHPGSAARHPGGLPPARAHLYAQGQAAPGARAPELCVDHAGDHRQDRLLERAV